MHKKIVATNIENDFNPIFNTHCSQRVSTQPVTGPVALINQYNYAREKCAQYTGEDRLPGGKEWLSRRVFGYKHAALGVKVSQIAFFVGCAVAAVGALYYLWNMDTEKQGDEDGEADQENINNDDVQDALKGIIR